MVLPLCFWGNSGIWEKMLMNLNIVTTGVLFNSLSETSELENCSDTGSIDPAPSDNTQLLNCASGGGSRKDPVSSVTVMSYESSKCCTLCSTVSARRNFPVPIDYNRAVLFFYPFPQCHEKCWFLCFSTFLRRLLMKRTGRFWWESSGLFSKVKNNTAMVYS